MVTISKKLNSLDNFRNLSNQEVGVGRTLGRHIGQQGFEGLGQSVVNQFKLFQKSDVRAQQAEDLHLASTYRLVPIFVVSVSSLP
jgi:hypothetical protein